VQSPGDLLRLVLSYAVSGWALQLVAAWADLLKVGRVSEAAVRYRLRQTRRWLNGEVARLLAAERSRWAGQAVRVRLVDATTVSRPGSTGTDWRLHMAIDLEHLAIDGLEITDGHGAESLLRQEIGPGEIVIADRVHGRRADVGHLLVHPIDLLVRIGWRNLPLETRDGQALDLVDWLQTLAPRPPRPGSRAARTAQQPPHPGDREVQVRTPQGVFPLRLIAAPLPPQAVAAARRRREQEARKKQRTVDQRTLVAAGFVILVTTLDAATWSTDDVLELYRFRWQIELLFKRLKGLWHLDELQARTSASAEVFLLGVILGALLAANCANTQAPLLDAWLADPDRPLSHWRWQALWRAQLRSAVLGSIDLATLQAALPSLRRCLCDSPRTRRQQAARTHDFLLAHAPDQERACA
jgi:hypothetical protein